MSLRANFPSATQSRVNLNFLRDLSEYDEVKPYHISGIISADHESCRTNMQFEKRGQVPFYNLRGQEHELSIDKHGFEMITVPKDISHLDVKGSQKQEYISHMTEIVKRRLSATLVLCYDYRVYCLALQVFLSAESASSFDPVIKTKISRMILIWGLRNDPMR
ncbi:uncharacterized protein LY89DRAFT_681235 [Mollisia scopiformis]|uniref:Uncharacterized protein n=1 Tax=Mollisia scopiformis TaxID=149040 RepID=A0A194XP48_MOLSC|nr:uncharacterized protein LY89DRAFT_681235 [Mollisia scopiformis]KUJ21854.1 hypothetical protein LY89DRAFT_681235 [Mollisia scopiformis]